MHICTGFFHEHPYNFRDTRNSTGKYSSVESSTIETNKGKQISPLEVQVAGASLVTMESIRAKQRQTSESGQRHKLTTSGVERLRMVGWGGGEV